VSGQDAILQQRLAKLNERMATLESAIADKPDFGLGKGDPRVTRWELNRALLEQLRERVTSTEDALSKIQHGMYGVCEICGQAIQPDRLAVLPDARLCIGCARSEPADGPGLSRNRSRQRGMEYRRQ
jgi:RNA polymerase-binding transcription factor DksA